MSVVTDRNQTISGLLSHFCRGSIFEIFDKNVDCFNQIYRKTVPRGGVAQLVRALPCHGRGYGFESRHSRHFPQR